VLQAAAKLLKRQDAVTVNVQALQDPLSVLDADSAFYQGIKAWYTAGVRQEVGW